MNLTKRSILIFDGDCALCNRSVIFLRRLRPDVPLLFSSNTSEAGRKIISDYHITANPDSTLILLHHGKIYLRTAAVRKALWLCGWKGRMLAAPLMLLPSPLTDPFYRLLARYRKRRKESACKLVD